MLRASCCKHICCSWYGCQTWDLPSKSVRQMNIEWNKAVRRTLHGPYTTHTNLLPLLVKGKPFKTQHFSRVSKFVQFRSNNTSVIFIGGLARYSSSGALGRNYPRCQHSAWVEIPDTDMLARSHCIRELLNVRDGAIDIPVLDIDEVLTTINEICCNWISLCIICNLFYNLKSYRRHYRVLMHIILRHFMNYMCRFFHFYIVFLFELYMSRCE